MKRGRADSKSGSYEDSCRRYFRAIGSFKSVFAMALSSSPLAPFMPMLEPNGSSPIVKPPISAIAPYNISNYVVCAIYIILILWSLFNLYSHLTSRLLIDAPKLLFGHVAVWGLGTTTAGD